MRGTKPLNAHLTAIGTNQLFAEIKELVFAAEDGDQRAQFLFCINITLSHALLRGSRRFNLRHAAGMPSALRRKAKTF